jgi:hypothetical protein
MASRHQRCLAAKNGMSASRVRREQTMVVVAMERSYSGFRLPGWNTGMAKSVPAKGGIDAL